MQRVFNILMFARVRFHLNSLSILTGQKAVFLLFEQFEHASAGPGFVARSCGLPHEL
jgi:hypothetical protein